MIMMTLEYNNSKMDIHIYIYNGDIMEISLGFPSSFFEHGWEVLTIVKVSSWACFSIECPLSCLITSESIESIWSVYLSI